MSLLRLVVVAIESTHEDLRLRGGALLAIRLVAGTYGRPATRVLTYWHGKFHTKSHTQRLRLARRAGGAGRCEQRRGGGRRARDGDRGGCGAEAAGMSSALRTSAEAMLKNEEPMVRVCLHSA